MDEYYVGEIMFVPYFRGAPQNWLICDGSSQSISNYEALYSLIGTTYGGDGVSTFNLPDLRGRVALHQGQGAGLSNYTVGSNGGAEQVTLNTNQLPAHTHQMNVTQAGGTSSSPVSGGTLASMGPDNSTTGATYTPPGGSQIAIGGVSSTGGSAPHSNIQPSQAFYYIICAFGVWPTPSS